MERSPEQLPTSRDASVVVLRAAREELPAEICSDAPTSTSHPGSERRHIITEGLLSFHRPETSMERRMRRRSARRGRERVAILDARLFTSARRSRRREKGITEFSLTPTPIASNLSDIDSRVIYVTPLHSLSFVLVIPSARYLRRALRNAPYDKRGNLFLNN